MRFLFVIFFSFSTVFISGCLFNEETRGPISDGKSPKTLFSEGMTFLSQGSYDDAEKNFLKLQTAYPSSKFSEQSKLELIYSDYKRGLHDEAHDKLSNFISQYPNHLSTPYALYMRGIISEDRSKSFLDDIEITDNAQRDVESVKQAMNYFLDLIKKYPDSEYAKESKRKLIKLRNILARHELFVAIFYSKKQAFISSINRCKYIIENFPDTPSVPAALHLIAYNYDKINAPKLAEDARSVLKKSYPKYTPHYSLED